MPEFRITSPEGKVYNITAPEGATKEEALQKLQDHLGMPSGMETRSGQPGTPVLSPAEQTQKNLAGYSEALKTGLPIAGDIALTLAMPEIQGPRLAGKAINLGSRMLGAGGGSAIGSALADLLTGNKPSIEDMKQQAILGAGGELGTTAIAQGIKVAKPLFSWFPDITFAGSNVKQMYNNVFRKQATQRAEKFLMDVAPESISKQMGKKKSISVMLNDAFAENSKIYDMYSEALKAGAERNNGKIIIDEVQSYLDDLYSQAATRLKEDASPVQIANEALRDLNYSANLKSTLREIMLKKKDQASAAQVEYLFAEVFKNKGWNKLNPTQQNLREGLKESLMYDLDRIPEAVAFKGTADEEYKALSKFNRLRRIYNKAINMDKEGFKTLSPDLLYENIMANKKSILKDPVLGELWPKLEQEAEAARIAGENLRRTSTKDTSGLSRSIGGGIGAFIGGAKGAAAMEGLGAASAYALLSDADQSLIQKIMSKTIRSTSKGLFHYYGEEMMPSHKPSLSLGNNK